MTFFQPLRADLSTGPLLDIQPHRARILGQVAERTFRELAHTRLPSEVHLSEALYQEKSRLRRSRPGLFTKKRAARDRALWNSLQSSLFLSPAQSERQALLARVVHHYAEEIGGYYDPRVYKFATKAVPFAFGWLLNAASKQIWNPWKQTVALDSRIKIGGEVEHLRRLSRRGTILMVPTHQSNIDSPLIGYLIYLMGLSPFAYGAGLNLFSNPALSYFMSNLGAYTVDRQKSNLIYKTVLKNYSTQILKEGVHSIFFPGGGRSRSGAIETKPKLGLLGTGLEAQLENHQAGKTNPRIFVVPMVMSYHFVLEASSLIEDFLSEAGKHRFIMMDDESWQSKKVAQFFWKFFSSKTGVVVRIGKPLDVFGNLVDEDGQSIGPNQTIIDPVKWLTTRGELRADRQRDQEYTRRLGAKLVERYYEENTVLTSHLAAFAYFEALREKYPDYDLFRLLRLTPEQRMMPLADFMPKAERMQNVLKQMEAQGKLHLCEELKVLKPEEWLKDGVEQLGFYHEAAVLKIQEQTIFTQDMTLLYYYRNRLSGYGISFRAPNEWMQRKPGHHDAQGFLA